MRSADDEPKHNPTLLPATDGGSEPSPLSAAVVAIASVDADHEANGTIRRRSSRLAISPVIERTWVPDREAMAAALRVVLDLPRALPHPADGERR